MAFGMDLTFLGRIGWVGSEGEVEGAMDGFGDMAAGSRYRCSSRK